MTEKQEALLRLAKAYGLTQEELLAKLESASAREEPAGEPESGVSWQNLPFQWKEPSVEGVSSVIDEFVDSLGTEDSSGGT